MLQLIVVNCVFVENGFVKFSRVFFLSFKPPYFIYLINECNKNRFNYLFKLDNFVLTSNARVQIFQLLTLLLIQIFAIWIVIHCKIWFYLSISYHVQHENLNDSFRKPINIELMFSDLLNIYFITFTKYYSCVIMIDISHTHLLKLY